ncbi:hypothetical protein PG995_001884 [Apiospora arundinis]
MPVMIWGNGACSANSRLHQVSLTQEYLLLHLKSPLVSPRRLIAIVSGTPNNGGGTMAEQITKGIMWAISNAGKGTYAHMDTSRAFDSRVTTIGIFNSGQYGGGGTSNMHRRITKPIFFFLGGHSDIAYGNGSKPSISLPFPFPSLSSSSSSHPPVPPFNKLDPTRPNSFLTIHSLGNALLRRRTLGPPNLSGQLPPGQLGNTGRAGCCAGTHRRRRSSPAAAPSRTGGSWRARA